MDLQILKVTIHSPDRIIKSYIWKNNKNNWQQNRPMPNQKLELKKNVHV